MKVTFKTHNDRFAVELEGDQKAIFAQIASFQEIFENTVCGACKSTQTRFVVRVVDDNNFYEIHCNQCRARLCFGAHKKGGTLFPHRKDSDNNWLPNSGWTKFTPPTKEPSA